MGKRRILVIDGNYFYHRALGQLNSRDSINNLETEEEKNEFWSQLNQGIVDLYETFNNKRHRLIDNIIFTVDNSSWRKEVEPHRPYYKVGDTSPIGYKEQRREKKTESPINYDNFDIIINKFTEHIKDNLITFDIKGLEGDDNLMLLSDKYSNDPNTELLIFCTDGDLEQTVKDNVLLFRNIKSKECPAGEFILTPKMYSQYFEPEKNAFLTNNIDKTEYKNLFSIVIGDTNGNYRQLRSINQGISTARPFYVALMKSICGDKKDNLFSILSWASKTGSMMYKITENHIVKALKIHSMFLTENTCKNILMDKENLMNLLLSLKEVTKQNHIDINVMGQHLKHNLKMNVLSKSNVPELYLNNWNTTFDNYLELLKQPFDETKLDTFRKNKFIKDKTTDTYKNSLPNL